MIRKLKIVPLRFMIQFSLKILLIVDGYLVVLQGSQTVVIKLNDGSITSRHFDHVRICSCDSPNEIQDDLPINISSEADTPPDITETRQVPAVTQPVECRHSTQTHH